MKKQIRSAVFETNSSSIHSLCIPTDKSYVIPDHVTFYLKCYGWGPYVEKNPGNYLYTALACLNDKEHIKQLENILYKHGVLEAEFQHYKPGDEYNVFYIDHVNECIPWINNLFAKEETLLRHLFTPGAAIYITNDNSPDKHILKKIREAEEREEEKVSLG